MTIVLEKYHATNEENLYATISQGKGSTSFIISIYETDKEKTGFVAYSRRKGLYLTIKTARQAIKRYNDTFVKIYNYKAGRSGKKA